MGRKMGRPRPPRLYNVFPNQKLEARCPRCGHKGFLPVEKIKRWFPDGMPLDCLYGYLRCTKCRKKGCYVDIVPNA